MWRQLWTRLTAPIVAQLTQGLSPSRTALAVALGVWFGIVPIVIGSVAFCLLAAWALRLNHVVIQTANYAVFPLQLALMYPFLMLGARVMHGPSLTLSPAELSARLSDAPMALLNEFWWVGVNATLVWAALGLVVVPLLWFVLRHLFTRVADRKATPKN